MSRVAAAIVAALAVIGTFGFVAYGLICGAKQVEGVPEGEPTAEATCVSYVHPFAFVLLVLTLGGLAGALAGRPLVPLGAGVVTGAVGSLGVFSLGFLGVGLAALLVASGALLPFRRRRLVAGTAVAAVAASSILILVAIRLDGTGRAHLPLELVWLLVLLPAVAWALLAARVAGRPT